MLYCCFSFWLELTFDRTRPNMLENLNNFVNFHIMSYCYQICLFFYLEKSCNDVASQRSHRVPLIYFSFLLAVLVNDGGKRNVCEWFSLYLSPCYILFWFSLRFWEYPHLLNTRTHYPHLLITRIYPLPAFIQLLPQPLFYQLIILFLS